MRFLGGIFLQMINITVHEFGIFKMDNALTIYRHISGKNYHAEYYF